MDAQTAQKLKNLTDDFYRRSAASFSQTRQYAWRGWKRVLDAVDEVCLPNMNVLDLGCGNLRFERFLADDGRLNDSAWNAYAIDNCTSLVHAGFADLGDITVHFRDLDIVQTLLNGADLGDAITAPLCDLSVAFGFFHHVPGSVNRENLLQTLIDKTRPGGFVVVSFWQFMTSKRLSAKTLITTMNGCAAADIAQDALDEEDYFLGWQDEEDVYRYCHHFNEDEIDMLADTVRDRAKETARFSADGEHNKLNRYLVLRVS